MSRHHFFLKQSDEIRNVISAKAYVSARAGMRRSLFSSIPFHAKLLAGMLVFFVTITEKILDQTLYVSNGSRELFIIESRARYLLSSLLQKGIVTSWTYNYLAPDQPKICFFNVRMADIISPKGNIYNMQGSVGTGVGTTLEETFRPALAELLERLSLSLWHTKKIIKGSYQDLKNKGAVDPFVFQFFSDHQLSKDMHKQSRLSHSQELHWVKARSLLEAKKCLVPASLVYIFYTDDNKDQPLFWQTSTNGVAAGATQNDAIYGALCEAVERDAFMIAWLNKFSPSRIDLNSIEIKKARHLVEELQKYNLEIHILDITTDLNIPSFAAVLIDRNGSVAVSVSAVADFDIEKALYKVLLEVLKTCHIAPNLSKQLKTSVEEKYPHIETFSERRALWSDKKMIEKIEFLLRGPQKDLSEIISQYEKTPKTVSEKIRKIKQALLEKKYSCYLVDVTSPEARQAGLYVVRAIVPELMPIYFRENLKHLGVGRLYSVPKALGHRIPANEKEFNAIPHPFI